MGWKSKLVLILFLLVGCSSSSDLGDGYILIRVNSLDNSISLNGNTIVPGFIRKYKVYGNYIVGSRSTISGSERKWYFVVNKKRIEYVDHVTKEHFDHFVDLMEKDNFDWSDMERLNYKINKCDGARSCK